MGWGGAWGRVRVRCPRVAQFQAKINNSGKSGPGSEYGGHSLRFRIEAPLITREVLPETYFLLVIMAADAQAGPVSSIMLMWNLVKF